RLTRLKKPAEEPTDRDQEQRRPPPDQEQLRPLVSWEQLEFLVEPLVKFLAPVAYLLHPGAGGWNRIYLCLVILWTLGTWALFGAAITRMAAVQFARNEKIGMTEALRFARSKYGAFLSAPLFPLGLIVLLTLFLILFGIAQIVTVFFG